MEITCADKTQFIERTNEEFEDDVDVVIEAGRAYAAGGLSKAAFEAIEKATAQNFNPLGFVADRTLREHIRPLDAMSQDWVHGLPSGNP